MIYVLYSTRPKQALIHAKGMKLHPSIDRERIQIPKKLAMAVTESLRRPRELIALPILAPLEMMQ